MRLAIIIFAAVILILVLVFVFILPTYDAAENSELPPVNDNAITGDPDEPNDTAALPEGLPVYPGARLIIHTENENEDIFEFQTTDSPEDVALFYVAEFESEGYEDFMYFYDDKTAEVQLQWDSYLVTVMADAANDTTVIKKTIMLLE